MLYISGECRAYNKPEFNLHRGIQKCAFGRDLFCLNLISEHRIQQSIKLKKTRRTKTEFKHN